MNVVAPLTIYLDEAGSPVFRELVGDERLRGYVPCAVAVPALAADRLQMILPRSKAGEAIKSSDRDFSEAAACRFVEALLSSEAEVAAILIDPADAKSIATARNNTALVNERRQAVHHPKISEAGFTYSILASQAITNVLKMTLKRSGRPSSFFDVVLDKAALSDVHERQFRKGLRSAAANHGMRVGRVDWVHEEDEPLLTLPDLVAGILHRDATHGDAQRARWLLQEAARSGRIHIQDGHRIELKREGAADADE